MDEHLIDKINRLQDVFATLDRHPIELPQITVVGSQSSGKSSVLENIVGRDFLPRGSGIVTRRPLILQLVNIPEGSGAEVDNLPKNASKDEWGEFQHLPNKKFYDFNQIREEIVRDTEKMTGANAGISPLPIRLKVYSPKVLTLTMVDLPGLTKVPVGDQPKDIERQIREMVMTFISNPNAIILAVTAANTDLANSDGLKLAREVDPEGVRTVGVLTKVDLMDRGTDLIDILAGRVIPLRAGYVPIINRSQQDINNNLSIRQALENERKFFQSHPSYAAKANYCGTAFLARKLTSMLDRKIRAVLPDVKAAIAANLSKFKAERASLGGDDLLDSPSTLVLNIITELCAGYRTMLHGNSPDVTTSELSGGARVSFVFHELYSNGVKAIDPFDQVKDTDIRTILFNASGSSPALFVGTGAFEVIVKQQIRRFEEPSLKCVSIVFDELVKILQTIVQKPIYRRYPNLREQIVGVVVGFLKQAVIPTNKLVSDIVNMEATYINTAHPDFISGQQAMNQVSEKLHPTKIDPKTGKVIPHTPQQNTPDGESSGGSNFFGSFFGAKNKKKAAMMEAPPSVIKASGTLSEREIMETDVIKLLITSYFTIVQRTLIDVVPKAIMLNLVKYSEQNMQRELLENLYRSEALNELLKESETTVERRNDLQRKIAALEKASEIVASV